MATNPVAITSQFFFLLALTIFIKSIKEDSFLKNKTTKFKKKTSLAGVSSSSINAKMKNYELVSTANKNWANNKNGYDFCTNIWNEISLNAINFFLVFFLEVWITLSCIF